MRTVQVSGQAKVREADLEIVVIAVTCGGCSGGGGGRHEKYVLGLDVAMDDPPLVQGGQRLEELPDDDGGLPLGVAGRSGGRRRLLLRASVLGGQLPPPVDGIEQLPAGTVLQNELDLVVVLVDVEEVGDVGDAIEGAEDLALVEAAVAPMATTDGQQAAVVPHGRRLGALPSPSGAAGEHDLVLRQALDGDQRVIGPADGEADRRRGSVAEDAALRRFREIVLRVDAAGWVGVGQPDGGGFVRLAVFRQAEALAALSLGLAGGAVVGVGVGTATSSLGLGAGWHSFRAYLFWTLRLRYGGGSRIMARAAVAAGIRAKALQHHLARPLQDAAAVAAVDVITATCVSGRHCLIIEKAKLHGGAVMRIGGRNVPVRIRVQHMRMRHVFGLQIGRRSLVGHGGVLGCGRRCGWCWSRHRQRFTSALASNSHCAAAAAGSDRRRRRRRRRIWIPPLHNVQQRICAAVMVLCIFGGARSWIARRYDMA
mmetsp:Transcript_1886/g.5502  ORF Transcript_1886/g.5502 Transcript_1886/m.5502 type:complete len:483 (+) Transcript_1886:3117-4565(+)